MLAFVHRGADNLDRPNIQAADTCSSLTLDLEHLDQLFIALLLESGHVFASQLICHTVGDLVNTLRSPRERVVLLFREKSTSQQIV